MSHRLSIALAAAIACCTVLLAPSAGLANQLVNGGFELPDASAGDVNTISGWSTFNDPNLMWITRGVPAQSGLQSLKMFGPWNQWGGVGMVQSLSAQPGQSWTAEVWSRNDSVDPMQGANFCVMKIEFLNAARGPAGGAWAAGVNVFEVKVADASSPRDVWQPFSVAAVAPPDTAFAQYVLVEVQGNNPPLGGSVFLDSASFVPEPASFVLLGLAGLTVLRRRR